MLYLVNPARAAGRLVGRAGKAEGGKGQTPGAPGTRIPGFCGLLSGKVGRGGCAPEGIDAIVPTPG
jgi:hypothetical protein